MAKIRTRIAPSPTGNLHIGTARTALFNYLFAKQSKGDFILRFEDTDKERSTKEFEKDIREGLKWLGMDWGEEYKQMDRLKEYKKYSDKLVKDGTAYEKDGAIWFKIPEDRTIEFKDTIRGKLRFETKEFKDFVIVKSDGIPTFYFSNVIDDDEMEISHVIRGEDHITNTPKQILISEALGLKSPEYAHVPLILNEDRSKLSKRKNPVATTDYRDKGYLPEGMINFLALMGWHPEGDKEFITLKELIKEFRLDKVQKSPAIFNIDKLNNINSHYIKEMTDKSLGDVTGVETKYIKLFKDRANTLEELKKLTKEIADYNEKYDSKTLIFRKSGMAKTKKGLTAATELLKKATNKEWESEEKLNGLLANVVKDNELDNGDVFWPVRVALSGLERSPSPPELLWALGQNESLKRLDKAI